MENVKEKYFDFEVFILYMRCIVKIENEMDN